MLVALRSSRCHSGENFFPCLGSRGDRSELVSCSLAVRYRVLLIQSRGSQSFVHYAGSRKGSFLINPFEVPFPRHAMRMQLRCQAKAERRSSTRLLFVARRTTPTDEMRQVHRRHMRLQESRRLEPLGIGLAETMTALQYDPCPSSDYLSDGPPSRVMGQARRSARAGTWEESMRAVIYTWGDKGLDRGSVDNFRTDFEACEQPRICSRSTHTQ